MADPQEGGGTKPIDPCMDAEDDVRQRTAAHLEAQRKLAAFNTAQREKEIRATRDAAKIAEFEATVRQLTQARDDTIKALDAAQKARDKCRKKHPSDPQAYRPVTLLLEWKDTEKIAYPPSFHGTYYNLRLTLSELAPENKPLGESTAWARIPGGHTHYGCVGSRQFLVPLDEYYQSSVNDLIERGKKLSGLDFADPPK